MKISGNENRKHLEREALEQKEAFGMIDEALENEELLEVKGVRRKKEHKVSNSR